MKLWELLVTNLWFQNHRMGGLEPFHTIHSFEEANRWMETQNVLLS